MIYGKSFWVIIIISKISLWDSEQLLASSGHADLQPHLKRRKKKTKKNPSFSLLRYHSFAHFFSLSTLDLLFLLIFLWSGSMLGFCFVIVPEWVVFLVGISYFSFLAA